VSRYVETFRLPCDAMEAPGFKWALFCFYVLYANVLLAPSVTLCVCPDRSVFPCRIDTKLD
jgi:hypothetical protein